MALSVTIWHNPRCSKSRQALALLQERGIDPQIRLYLSDPPDLAELRALHKKLGTSVIAFTRTGEKMFRDLGLTKTTDDQTLLKAMAEYPILIERAIVLANGKATVGRPPKRVLDIL